MKQQAIYRPLDEHRRPVVASVDDLLASTRAALGTAALAIDAPTGVPTPAPAPAARSALSPRAQLGGGVLVAVVAVFVLALLLGRSTPAAAPLAAPTAPPAAPSAPAATPAAPQPPAPQGARLAAPVAAFAAPDGAYLGIIEAGRAYTATARLGEQWTQIDAAGSGLVWAAARELTPDGALPDLSTPTPRPAPTSPPAPAVVEQQEAPAPTRCATVRGGGIEAQACGNASDDALQATAEADWQRQFGGNRATVATMTPYGEKP